MFCPQCGTKLPDEAKFCSKRGNSISEQPRSNNIRNQKSGNTPLSIFRQITGQEQSQLSEGQKCYWAFQLIAYGIWVFVGVVCLLIALTADISSEIKALEVLIKIVAVLVLGVIAYAIFCSYGKWNYRRNAGIEADEYFKSIAYTKTNRALLKVNWVISPLIGLALLVFWMRLP